MCWSNALTPPLSEVPLTDSSLREELVDELDQNAVSSELLSGWAEMEAKEMRVLATTMPLQQPLPQPVREAALRFLHALAETLHIKQHGWLDTVLLFDRYCSSNQGSVALHIGSLPELCVAIAVIVKKVESSSSVIKVVALANLATQYAQWLAGMGFTSGAHCVLEEHVARQESVVINALDWRVTSPSVHMWLGVLCRRFDILTRGMSTATLDWVNSQGITSAGMLVMHQVAFVRMSPRTMANGLFCTFLAVAAIVPAESLRPAKLSEREWEALLSESQCQGARPLGGGRPASQSLLGLLQVVAGCALPELQADTHAVLSAMRDIAVGLRAQGAQGRPCARQQATAQHGKSRAAQGAGLSCRR